MTVADLRQWLAQFPPDAQVFKSAPVQGDCENCREAKIGSEDPFVPGDLFFDDRYPAVVIM